MPFTETSSCSIDKWFVTDSNLHHVYPPSIQLLARRHWTPLCITQMVVTFLTPQSGDKVLDIGSGVGKFCLAGAYYKPMASFFGVEQRKDLVAHAETARNILGLQNAHFVHSNFTELDFTQYNHFYFFNSFYENLANTEKIDNNITYSDKLYNYYNRCLYKKLEHMPPGTRLVTYHVLDENISPGYHLVEAQLSNLLKFWIKL
jgi:hypothetical protein